MTGTPIPVDSPDKTQTDLSENFSKSGDIERGHRPRTESFIGAAVLGAVVAGRRVFYSGARFGNASEGAPRHGLRPARNKFAARILYPLLAQAPIKVVPSVVPDADASGGVVEARPTQPQAGPMASRERPRRRRV